MKYTNKNESISIDKCFYLYNLTCIVFLHKPHSQTTIFESTILIGIVMSYEMEIKNVIRFNQKWMYNIIVLASINIKIMDFFC